MPETITQCTCSICRRYGAMWVYRTRQTARVLNGPEVETCYLWNDKAIEFYHCNTCGCLTRYEVSANLTTPYIDELSPASLFRFQNGRGRWRGAIRG